MASENGPVGQARLVHKSEPEKSAPRMDTWPANATLSPYPLLQGGALTSATLHEDEHGRFEWITAQNRAYGINEKRWSLILLIKLV